MGGRWNYPRLSFPVEGDDVSGVERPVFTAREIVIYTKVYPKVSGLATCSENRKCYFSLPLAAVISLFCESF
jgi:hypothetical protein